MTLHCTVDPDRAGDNRDLRVAALNIDAYAAQYSIQRADLFRPCRPRAAAVASVCGAC